MRHLLEDLTPHCICPIKASKVRTPEARERVEPQMRQILALLVKTFTSKTLVN